MRGTFNSKNEETDAPNEVMSEGDGLVPRCSQFHARTIEPKHSHSLCQPRWRKQRLKRCEVILKIHSLSPHVPLLTSEAK